MRINAGHSDYTRNLHQIVTQLNANRLYWVVVFLLLLLGVSQKGFGMDQQQFDELLANASIDELDTMDGLSLGDARAACANEGIAAARARLAERDVSMAETYPFCTAVLEEALNRGEGAELYGSLARGNFLDLSAGDMFGLIFQAADQNHDAIDIDGTRIAISDTLAFDAGFTGGYAAPEAPNPDLEAVPADQRDQAVLAVARQCLDEAIDVANAHCHAAGQYMGARYRQGDRVATLTDR